MSALTSSVVHTEPRGTSPRHQHDPRARHTGDLRAHAAEPGSLCAGRVTHKPSDDPLPAFAEHYLQACGAEASARELERIGRLERVALDEIRETTQVQDALSATRG